MLSLALLACACSSGAVAARKDAAGGADSPDARPGISEDASLTDAMQVDDVRAPQDQADAPVAQDWLLPDAGATGDVEDRHDQGMSAQDGQRIDSPAGGLSDGSALEVAADGDLPIDGGLAGFCTGDSPRMVVNGTAVTPTIKGDRIMMDSFEGGQFTITNADLDFPIGVSWRMPSDSSSLPVTIDLANPPSAWQLMVAAGCNVNSAGCVGPMDYYRSGLVGWLAVARDSSGKFDMSVCVHVAESPGETKYWLHSLDFYAMHVLTW
jgi:hypothetical protein